MVTHDIKSVRRGNRIIYLQDGGIMGECELGKYVSGDKQRHEKVRKFLEGNGMVKLIKSGFHKDRNHNVRPF